MTDEVQVTRDESGVALIELGADLNLLHAQRLSRLAEIAGEFQRDIPSAVVITGERNFSAGADLNELAGEQVALILNKFSAAFDAVASIPAVTIAAIAGAALGGGYELALACDMRMASEDAVVGLPEVTLGIMPGAGGTQRLPRLVGSGRAKELIFSGRRVLADEALRIGLVDRVVPSGQLRGEAIAWASTFASAPAQSIALSKFAIDQGAGLPMTEALRLEREYFVRVLHSDEARQRLRSFLGGGGTPG